MIKYLVLTFVLLEVLALGGANPTVESGDPIPQDVDSLPKIRGIPDQGVSNETSVEPISRGLSGEPKSNHGGGQHNSKGNQGGGHYSHGNQGGGYNSHGNQGGGHNSHGNQGGGYNSHGNQGGGHNSHGHQGGGYNSHGNQGGGYNSHGNHGGGHNSHGKCGGGHNSKGSCGSDLPQPNGDHLVKRLIELQKISPSCSFLESSQSVRNPAAQMSVIYHSQSGRGCRSCNHGHR